MILKKMELFSISWSSQTIKVINWSPSQSGNGRKALVGGQFSLTTWFFDSRLLLPPRSSQIKERLMGNWSRGNLARWTYWWGSPRDFFSVSSRAVETWG